MSNEIVWRPFQKQEDFLSLPDTVYEALYGGAAGGGKSECLLLLPLVRGFYKHPKFKGIIFRRTYSELEKEIILRSQHWYKPAGARYSDDKKRWSFPSGAIMQFGHAEYENDVRKYDTSEYNYMAFDELTSFTEFQYLYLAMSRVRSSTRELPTLVRSGTNPGNIGHGWVRKRFIEPAPFGTIINDAKTKLKRIFIQSMVTDNPHIDPEYINKLSALPEAEIRAKRDGDWWTFSGQVFDEWRSNRMDDEPENAVHVIDDFEIPKWWPRMLSIDWGYKAMTCALWGAVSPDLRFYVYREYTIKEAKISTWATDIGRLSHGEDISDCVLCKSAWQNRGEELLISEQFEKYSGIRPREADNARVAGKILLQEYIRWRPMPERRTLQPRQFSKMHADRVLRVFGIEEYKEYLALFEPAPPETNLPKLQVMRSCTEAIICIPLCVYDEKNREDVATFDGDDPYDTLRYLIQSADLRMKANDEDDYRQRLASVCNAFQRTGDYNAFQRQIERMDTVHEVKPMRRFHGPRARRHG